MRTLHTMLPEVKIFQPRVFADERGSFHETFRLDRYGTLGIETEFVQHNQSWSTAGVLRGLHAQLARPQGKLIRVVHGEVFDVAVDIRPASPRFLRWTGAILSAENARQIWVPGGFAHGFCVLGESACVEYKCTDYWTPDDQLFLRWDDPEIGIHWPIDDPVLSDQDRDAKTALELMPRLTASQIHVAAAVAL